MEQVTNEKALQYAQGKLNEALTNAIATAYADGYKAGYADGEKNKPAEVSPAIETKTNFVDLGLPSGTLWADDYEVDSEGNIVELPYIKAQEFNLPTDEQWDELKEQCLWRHKDGFYTCLGRNGNEICFKAENNVAFWTHKEKEESPYGKCIHVSSSSQVTIPYRSAKFMGEKIAIRQVSK